MFIGHYAVGLAAKRLAPRTSLGTLLAGATLLDLVWPVFLLAGWEEVRIEPGNTAFTPLAFERYPLSHSLLATAVWAAGFGLAYLALTRYRAGAVVVAGAVASHWVLDALTHRPDLALWPGSATRVGLGLWNSVAGTIAVEGVLFAAAVWIYRSATRARDLTGTWALAGFVAFAAIAYAGAATGQPPPSPRLLALVSLAAWVVPVWGWWIDRHREPRWARSPGRPEPRAALPD